MGEMADDAIDRMLEDGYFPSHGFLCRRGRNSSHKQKKKPKVREYPEKTFDMGFFPTSIPKPRTVVEPKEQAPDPWATDGEDAPF